jgi:hypothetical protein
MEGDKMSEDVRNQIIKVTKQTAQSGKTIEQICTEEGINHVPC